MGVGWERDDERSKTTFLLGLVDRAYGWIGGGGGGAGGAGGGQARPAMRYNLAELERLLDYAAPRSASRTR